MGYENCPAKTPRYPWYDTIGIQCPHCDNHPSDSPVTVAMPAFSLAQRYIVRPQATSNGACQVLVSSPLAPPLAVGHLIRNNY